VTFLTDIADQAVILPLVLAITLALFAQGWRRGATAWAVAVCATFGVILALKVTFMACSTAFGTSEIQTPSGHVAAAAVVAGGFAALLLRGRIAALTLAALAAVAIGITRLALGAHTAAEVLIGAGVGLLGAWVLLALAGRTPPGLNARRMLLMAVVVIAVFHGQHLPAEARIRSTAERIARMLPVCQPAEARL